MEIKTLISLRNNLGKPRHFTPAAQEWYNSIYTYNKNYIKSLTISDKSIMKLLKSYFNSLIKKNFIQLSKFKRIIKTKRTTRKFKRKRLSTKKIFIGKGGLKHFNSKVVITFYVYNTEAMFLSHKIKKMRNALFFPISNLEKTVFRSNLGKERRIYNRLSTMVEFLTSPKRYINYFSSMYKYINKQTFILVAINKLYKRLNYLVFKKIITKKEKLLIFNNSIKYLSFSKNIYDFSTILPWFERGYKKKYFINKLLLYYNKAKFTRIFISKLIHLVQKIYNKNVEFNIVNLKKLHLNSDIYTQVIALKLKNRKNRLLRVLKASLRRVKVVNINKLTEKQINLNKDRLLVNRIGNNTINSMFDTNYLSNNYLENLLLNFLPSINNLKINKKIKKFYQKSSISLINYVLTSLKHNELRGIRVEAKGRLTRRFTASRSIFKMKWKGGLKNTDSSFKGLSTIMLRGIKKSNVEFSIMNSKNRNGAFAIKGWVSSK